MDAYELAIRRHQEVRTTLHCALGMTRDARYAAIEDFCSRARKLARVAAFFWPDAKVTMSAFRPYIGSSSPSIERLQFQVVSQDARGCRKGK